MYSFIISKVVKYRKILLKYNAYMYFIFSLVKLAKIYNITFFRFPLTFPLTYCSTLQNFKRLYCDFLICKRKHQEEYFGNKIIWLSVYLEKKIVFHLLHLPLRCNYTRPGKIIKGSPNGLFHIWYIWSDLWRKSGKILKKWYSVSRKGVKNEAFSHLNFGI